MQLRDHDPITLDKFNGLWAREDPDNTPLDHFQDCQNVRHIGNSSFGTRDGIGISQDVLVPLSNVKRIYNYPMQDGNTLIVLVKNDADQGEIHHVVDENTTFGPVLTVAQMDDFAFVPYAGRAYISPFTDFSNGELTMQKGVQNEFVYVYNGDGTQARKIAGSPLTGTLTIANGAAGHTDPGLHIFGFVSETDTGFLAAPGALASFTTLSTNSVSFGTVPVSADPHVIKRHLVASKAIVGFNGDVTGYQLFFVPNATINDNTSLFLNNVSFYDADLLDDASHLIDNFTSVPAGAVLSIYHNRLCIAATYNDISLIQVSAEGEPEAISQIDGLIVVPLDGNPITNIQELRDVMYVFKRSRTVAFVDNGDVPSSWQMVVIDNALGTCVHGVATVLDSGSASVDYLAVCSYAGVILFNGQFIIPELSWKIEEYWRTLERNDFDLIQIVNAPIQKEFYIVLPTRLLLSGNYSLGMDPKSMRWEPWGYIMGVNTVAIHNIDEIILGADLG